MLPFLYVKETGFMRITFKDFGFYLIDEKYLKILSALDIKKMVPVPEGVYEKKNFDQETDLKYKYLLQKEYSFCLKIRKGIIEKAENLYKQQKDTSVVFKYYCDFTKLEKACDEYES